MTSLADQRHAHDQQTERLRARLKRLARLLVIAGLAALMLRGFAYEPFSLPSQSMQPGLQPGDTIFVAKSPYGLSRHNLPLSPSLLQGRLFARLPSRGDVIVFKTPRDGQTDFVKRVIALPGDTIAMRRGRPILNGQPLPRTITSQTKTTRTFQEVIPNNNTANNRRYTVNETISASAPPASAAAPAPRADFGPITVPPGKLFLLGDNRDASADSRYSPAEGGIGLVPLDLVIGRADIIIHARQIARIGNRS